MRARIDVSEIEAQTKIRAKYLRALENEEWALLPGPTFVKSFLRTYAQALGLDGKALVEEYRLHHETGGEPFEPIVAAPRRASRPSRPGRTGPGGRVPVGGPSRGYVIAVAAIGAVIVLLVVLLVTSGSGGGGGKSPTASRSSAHAKHRSGSRRTVTTSPSAHASAAPVVALSLKASAVVYVCLVGDNGRILVPGVELQPEESTATFHDRHYELTLGNSSVTMYVDGRARAVAPSSEAIGYTITHARGRQPLAPARRPTCSG